jgi:hypothetical protein
MAMPTKRPRITAVFYQNLYDAILRRAHDRGHSISLEIHTAVLSHYLDRGVRVFGEPENITEERQRSEITLYLPDCTPTPPPFPPQINLEELAGKPNPSSPWRNVSPEKL